jgi:ABC-type sugar transport system ATPase subunit
MSHLELRNIEKSFPGVKALQGVNLTVESGEIHALCGENGAGKSTLMNILAGNIQPDHGEVIMNGLTITLPDPSSAFQVGIALVYQHLSLIESLSVAENIYANSQPKNSWGLIDYRTLYSMASDLLGQLHIDLDPRLPVKQLSLPQRQLVEIAKALSKRPSLLILDEPTASLTEREIRTLFSILKELKNEGVTIIYISHRLEEVFEITDRVTILKDGKWQGTFQTLELDRTKLIRLMVGREVAALKPQSFAKENVLLEVNALTSLKFTNISFNLQAGEIVGMAGLAGAGRTEIARAIFGIDSFDSGEIFINKTLHSPQHPADSIAAGIAYVPEDRKNLGLFPEMSVQDNLVAACLDKVKTGAFFNSQRASQFAHERKEQLKINTPHVHQAVNALSGGNQQKVVLGKWLLTDPDILMVDEPTHGVDIGARFEIYETLKQLAAQGKGILMISSDLPELIGLCDRIIVIKEGKLTGEVSGSEATEETILEMASG